MIYPASQARRVLEQQFRETFLRLAVLAHESVQFGSAITGAPGQPVQTGNLRASIQLTFPTPTSALISTNVIYARSIEDGVVLARSGQVTGSTGQRLVLRSAVGGFHSFKLTVAATDRLLAAAVAETRQAA